MFIFEFSINLIHFLPISTTGPRSITISTSGQPCQELNFWRQRATDVAKNVRQLRTGESILYITEKGANGLMDFCESIRQFRLE